MAIIIDLKNAIRKAIYVKDNTINFFFNEILKVEYPYIFFYIPSFKLDKAIDNEYWRKLNLLCVVEYAKDEDSTATELWSYADTLTEAYSLFDFADTKLSAKDPDLKLVDGVLQMTFNLEFYVKLDDETQDEDKFMQELHFNIKRSKFKYEPDEPAPLEMVFDSGLIVRREGKGPRD